MSGRPIVPCNPDRFWVRVFQASSEGLERAYCRCCGTRVKYVMGDDGTPDWYCRWCEQGHPDRTLLPKQEQLW